MLHNTRNKIKIVLKGINCENLNLLNLIQARIQLRYFGKRWRILGSEK